MNNRNNFFIGAIFVVLGCLLLTNNLNIFHFSLGHFIGTFWATLFLIVPGIAMHSIYFSGKRQSPGVLVPAGIILVTGIVCQLSTFFHLWGILWPGFILSVAVGLFELYLYGGRQRGLLIPVFILGGLSFIFFYTITFHSFFSYRFRSLFIPVLLIVFGVALVGRNLFKRRDY